MCHDSATDNDRREKHLLQERTNEVLKLDDTLHAGDELGSVAVSFSSSAGVGELISRYGCLNVKKEPEYLPSTIIC